MSAVPTEVEALTRTCFDLVDTALPEFVENLYLVGSTALGAWQPPHSDIDSVIVVSEPITTDHLKALQGGPSGPARVSAFRQRLSGPAGIRCTGR
jgi:hypothetical protein